MYGKLSEAQRQAILAKLEDADDFVLLEAVRNHRERETMVMDRFKALHEWLGVRMIDTTSDAPILLAAVKTTKPSYAAPAEPKPQINKKPTAEPAAKIGTANRELILARLKQGPNTADEINGALRRGDGMLEATEGLLALMWKRDEVLFDGELYSACN